MNWNFEKLKLFSVKLYIESCTAVYWIFYVRIPLGHLTQAQREFDRRLTENTGNKAKYHGIIMKKTFALKTLLTMCEEAKEAAYTERARRAVYHLKLIIMIPDSSAHCSRDTHLPKLPPSSSTWFKDDPIQEIKQNIIELLWKKNFCIKNHY